MGGYEELIAGIKAVVRRNGRREITGDALQQVLVGMVSAIGANSAFAGVATPDTDPGSPDANVFWIAATPGTYAHFGNAVVTASAILSNETGSWVATPLNFGEPYKPFPEFFFTSGKTIYYTGTTPTLNRQYVYYYNRYAIHLYGAASAGLEGMKINFYPYCGQNRNVPPFLNASYSADLSEAEHHIHGEDIVVSLPINSLYLMWKLGFRGENSLDSYEVFSDDLDYFLRGVIEGKSPGVKMFKPFGSVKKGTQGGVDWWDDKWREITWNYHSKYQGAYLQPGRFSPIVTLRFAAALSRGKDTGPRQQYRIGIYSMKKPGGDSGLATRTGADYFIRCGYIQKVDKAYRY